MTFPMTSKTIFVLQRSVMSECRLPHAPSYKILTVIILKHAFCSSLMSCNQSISIDFCKFLFIDAINKQIY